MIKVFYVAISNDNTINGNVVISDAAPANIEQYIVGNILDNNEDWYDLYITHLTELHVVVCNGIESYGYMVRMNGTHLTPYGDIIFNYIDIDDDSKEVIRYMM